MACVVRGPMRRRDAAKPTAVSASTIGAIQFWRREEILARRTCDESPQPWTWFLTRAPPRRDSEHCAHVDRTIVAHRRWQRLKPQPRTRSNRGQRLRHEIRNDNAPRFPTRESLEVALTAQAKERRPRAPCRMAVALIANERASASRTAMSNGVAPESSAFRRALDH